MGMSVESLFCVCLRGCMLKETLNKKCVTNDQISGSHTGYPVTHDGMSTLNPWSRKDSWPLLLQYRSLLQSAKEISTLVTICKISKQNREAARWLTLLVLGFTESWFIILYASQVRCGLKWKHLMEKKMALSPFPLILCKSIKNVSVKGTTLHLCSSRLL